MTNNKTVYRRNQALGNDGENLAEKFLFSKGYTIIARNIKIKRIEVDFIVLDKNTTVFVEVKTRSSTNFGEPITAVTKEKLKRMYIFAHIYTRIHKISQYRFDIIGITMQSDGSVQALDYYKDITLP